MRFETFMIFYEYKKGYRLLSGILFRRYPEKRRMGLDEKKDKRNGKWLLRLIIAQEQ